MTINNTQNLTGIKPYSSMPNVVAALGPRAKNAVAGAALAARIGLAGAVYGLMPDIKDKTPQTTTLKSKTEENK